MTENSWSFCDPPNEATFVDKRIVDGDTWIYYASHDAEDGAWQFHGPDGFADQEHASVVGLKQIVALDKSIVDLYDLPLGWCAWRESPKGNWQRSPIKSEN